MGTLRIPLNQLFAAPASALRNRVDQLVLVDTVIILNLAAVDGVVVVVVARTPTSTGPGVGTGPGTTTSGVGRGRGTDTTAVAAPTLADAGVRVTPVAGGAGRRAAGGRARRARRA